jgi:hypothetical protein
MVILLSPCNANKQNNQEKLVTVYTRTYLRITRLMLSLCWHCRPQPKLYFWKLHIILHKHTMRQQIFAATCQGFQQTNRMPQPMLHYKTAKENRKLRDMPMGNRLVKGWVQKWKIGIKPAKSPWSSLSYCWVAAQHGSVEPSALQEIHSLIMCL